MIKYNIIIAAIVSLEIRLAPLQYKSRVGIAAATISVRSRKLCDRAPIWAILSTKSKVIDVLTWFIVGILVLEKITHCHTAIHGPFFWGVDEKEYQGRNENNGSYYAQIRFLQLTQIIGVILIEDNQKNVPCCCECPEYICEWKPANSCQNCIGRRLPGYFKNRTYIWRQKAWNWHNAEPLPASGPLRDIIVAMKSNKL